MQRTTTSWRLAFLLILLLSTQDTGTTSPTADEKISSHIIWNATEIQTDAPDTTQEIAP